ncbi:methyl-accepting chemotaxis protein [Acuticoccus sp. I52.16.1]|uniref:methyl-accepting chemotaxis protein n=1 Tax=Acuticoccus sp. I52.16.1 TaxID=2928472 RepID=UPI001FD58D70|nr:methyl-accepting chemotaxis protein [Acuticoccus sp. I52.16.1]UOM36311.1 methyl-accepting chemotaxis protein [Acuticoccus sp. I52.16.1]
MMANLSISKKLWVAFAGIIAVTMLSAGFILYESLKVVNGLEESGRRSEQLELVDAWHRAASDTHAALLAYINSGDVTNAERVEGGFARSDAAQRDLSRVVDPGADLSGDVSTLARLLEQWRSEVAETQLDEMTDPLTFDMARLRELSVLNQRLWSDIDRGFAKISSESGRALTMQREYQLRDLKFLMYGSLGSAVVILVVSMVMAIVMRLGVALPVKRLAETTGRLKDHDWSVEIEGTTRGDEIGEMARALEVFREQGEHNEEVEAEHKREAEEKARRAEEITEAVRGFRGQSSQLLAQLSEAGIKLDGAATSLDDVVGASYSYTRTVNDAAMATGLSVKGVAAAVEEMTASIHDISGQLQNVSNLTQTTTDATETATAKVNGLKERSDEIHQVVDLINGIAGQINLLALNATIEAARAGDAGKGFAVVAHEVKQLADQTAKATEDIGRVIGHVSSEVDEVVQAIGLISSSIAEVNGNSAAVAAAVEEQSAALGEISRNVNEVSAQTTGVADNVQGVENKVGETRQVATSVNQLSKALQASSNDLSGSIDAFIGTVANDDVSARSAV